MGRPSHSVVGSSRSPSPSSPSEDLSISGLDWPFGRIPTLSRSDLRETAYELYFMSSRSSPATAGRSSPSDDAPAPPLTASPRHGAGTGMMTVTSRIKKSLGLKTRRSSRNMRAMAGPSSSPALVPSSPSPSPSPAANKLRRPMTSAELMRQQMSVTEHSDARLRKTLTRISLGQANRRAETIILPLELLRQLKPSQFPDPQEYHHWQRRQLKVLEAGLLLHPSTPVERLNASALRFREVMRASEARPIDTSSNSESMRTLYSSVISLAWRNSPESCHWADGFPFNIHLYLSLLHSIFDLRDETVVLDEVDELVELIKKTWSTLGINRAVHNVCFTWTLFHQYVATGQTEPDLIGAALAMLPEVAADAKRPDREPGFTKIASCAMGAMQGWAERRVLDYHDGFDRSTVMSLESVIDLALAATKIIHEDLPSAGIGLVDRDGERISSSSSRVDFYIRAAMRNTFTKILENGRHVGSMIVEVDEDPSELITQLAKDTEAVATEEREVFSPVLRRWHPMPAAVAVATLHSCFRVVLKQYLARVTILTNELVRVLHSAGKIEKVLVQMVVEESADFEEGGRDVVREMIPYEIDSIVVGLLKSWIEERLRIGKECLNRAKETESWIPRPKAEPYAQSAVDLMRLAKVTVDEFFDIPVASKDDMVQDLADGLEVLFQDYISFVASCGSKQSYIPTLPPLTRCNQDSRFTKLWMAAAAPCKTGVFDSSEPSNREGAAADGQQPPQQQQQQQHPRISTSRGTQRLYIRLNSLHYLHSHIHSLDKSLSLSSARASRGPSPAVRHAASNRRLAPSTHFDGARASIQTAIQQVAEVAAYRLIFVDSRHYFLDGLYAGGVSTARIRPALRILKQNLAFLVSIVADRAQPMAVKEVMRAAFEAFLTVLLAGGSERAFVRSDYEMVMEDFKSLKRLFCTCGEGLVAEEVVGREAEVVEGVVGLMGQATERLVEDLGIAVGSEAGGGGIAGGRVPMPAAAGRWSRAEPATVLRLLCHRNDDAADQFLKRAFQMPKRR